MSEQTEKVLLEWDADEHNISGDDVFDALNEHFIEFGRWHWVEISDEARRVWNLMFKDKVENGSPMDGVWTAAAAQASDGAFEAMAAALGVESFALQAAIAPWLENQDCLPPPVTAKRLLDLCEEAVAARRKLLAARVAKGMRHG